MDNAQQDNNFHNILDVVVQLDIIQMQLVMFVWYNVQQVIVLNG
jgi:hypothetical protein